MAMGPELTKSSEVAESHGTSSGLLRYHA